MIVKELLYAIETSWRKCPLWPHSLKSHAANGVKTRRRLIEKTMNSSTFLQLLFFFLIYELRCNYMLTFEIHA